MFLTFFYQLTNDYKKKHNELLLVAVGKKSQQESP